MKTKQFSEIKQGDIFTYNKPDNTPIQQCHRRYWKPTRYVYNICLSRRKSGVRVLIIDSYGANEICELTSLPGTFYLYQLNVTQNGAGFSPLQ